MAVTLPVVNGSSGVWGTILNAALTDIDNRLTTATTSSTTAGADITNLQTRMATAETNVTNLQTTGGSTYANRASLPGTASNGAKAVTTDSGLTWTHYEGNWYPPPGTLAGSLFQSTAQTLPTATPTLIAFDSARSSFPIGSYSLGSAASWNCTVPGWYTAVGGVSFGDTVPGIGYRQAQLYKGTSSANAVAVSGSSNVCAPNQQNATTTSLSTRTTSIYIAAGERLFVYGNHSQGTSIATAAAGLTSFYSTLSVTFVGWFPAV